VDAAQGALLVSPSAARAENLFVAMLVQVNAAGGLGA